MAHASRARRIFATIFPAETSFFGSDPVRWSQAAPRCGRNSATPHRAGSTSHKQALVDHLSVLDEALHLGCTVRAVMQVEEFF